MSFAKARPPEHSVPQARAVEMSATEISRIEVSRIKICSFKVSIAEVNVHHANITEVSALKMGITEVGATEVVALQANIGEIYRSPIVLSLRIPISCAPLIPRLIRIPPGATCAESCELLLIGHNVLSTSIPLSTRVLWDLTAPKHRDQAP